MPSQVAFARNEFSTTQESQLIYLPDIPGQVVEVHNVIGQVVSFSASSANLVALYHNTDLGTVLNANDFGAQWCRLELSTNTGAAIVSPVSIYYPVPYELVGPQRMDTLASAGNVDVVVMIIYTMRAEPNRTLWNALRQRTSFERGV